MDVEREVAGGTSSARRRRERRLRSMLRHERIVAMALAEALHHSSGLKVMERAQHAALRSQETGTRAGVAGPAPVTEYVAPAPAVAPFSTPAVTCEAPAPVIEYVAPTPAVTYAAPAPVVGYVAPAPAVTYAAPAPVIDYVAPAPAVTYAAPAPVFEYVTPAPVLEYIAPSPAGSFVAPSQQLRPAYSAAAVTTGVNLDADVVGSASQVVGSLPHGEVFAAPVFNQVHQEQLAGGEIPENLVEIPVVQKQVIVQASPHVVGSLPPVAEFTSPMYNPVHQEQFSAGDTAEKFAIFPVVQEQVLVGLRPAPPSEVAGPQGAAATGGYVAGGAPLLAVSSLRGFDGVDDITAKFLLQQALKMKEKEEEERVKREKEQLKRQEDQEEARLTRLQAERDALLVLGLETLSSQQKKRLNAVLDEREAILDRRERRRVVAKRKRKKRRKKKTPKSSSSCGRARRRQRQWHVPGPCALLRQVPVPRVHCVSLRHVVDVPVVRSVQSPQVLFFGFYACPVEKADWISSNDEVCADNYIYFRFKLKGRSVQWVVFLYGDKTIKVDRDSAEVLSRGVPPPGIGGVGFGSSPNLATDHTIYELCLPSVRGMGMSMNLADPVSSGKYSGTSCRDVLHSHFDRKHHRCHCSCRDHVHCVGRLHCLCNSNVQRGCLRRLVV